MPVRSCLRRRRDLDHHRFYPPACRSRFLREPRIDSAIVKMGLIRAHPGPAALHVLRLLDEHRVYHPMITRCSIPK